MAQWESPNDTHTHSVTWDHTSLWYSQTERRTVYSTGNLNSDEVISLKVSVFPKDVNEALNFYSLVAVNLTSLL